MNPILPLYLSFFFVGTKLLETRECEGGGVTSGHRDVQVCRLSFLFGCSLVKGGHGLSARTVRELSQSNEFARSHFRVNGHMEEAVKWLSREFSPSVRGMDFAIRHPLEVNESLQLGISHYGTMNFFRVVISHGDIVFELSG